MDRLRKARNRLNLLFLWTKVDVSRLEKSFVWCRRPDSWFKEKWLIFIDFLIVGVQRYTVKVRDGR